MNLLTPMFNEAVIRGSGNIEIHNADGSLFETISVQDLSHVSLSAGVSGVYVNVHLSNPLSSGASYYVTIAPGVFKDVAGNAFAGITSPSTFNFTTHVLPDGVPPVLLSTNPTDDGTNVAVNGIITLTFNEAVQIDVGEIRIQKLSAPWTTFNIQSNDPSQVTVSGNTVIVDPSIDFDPNSEYSVWISSNVFADMTWTWFPGITFSFGTGSNSTPELVSLSPTDNSSDVAVDSVLMLTFDQAVTAGLGNIEIHNADGSLFERISVDDTDLVNFSGEQVSIDPAADFAHGASYYLTVDNGAIENAGGAAYGGIVVPTVFNFTTVGNPGLVLTGNSLNNTLVGGVGDDTITGLGGRDTLTGAAGFDTFVYGAASHSTSRTYDTITDFDSAADVLDLWFQVTGVDASISGGSVSARRFDSDLASAVNGTKLAAHHAVVYTPNAGVPAGSKFLIVDVNGQAGYQAGADLVILLGANSTNLASLTISDFV